MGKSNSKKKEPFDWNGTIKQTLVTLIISSLFGISGYFLARRIELRTIKRENLSNKIEYYNKLDRSASYKIEKEYLRINDELEKKAFILAAVKEMTDDKRLKCDEQYYKKLLGKDDYKKLIGFYENTFMKKDSVNGYPMHDIAKLLTFYGQLKIDIKAGLLDEKETKDYFAYYLYWFKSFSLDFLLEYEKRIDNKCDKNFHKPNWLITKSLFYEWKLVDTKQN